VCVCGSTQAGAALLAVLHTAGTSDDSEDPLCDMLLISCVQQYGPSANLSHGTGDGRVAVPTHAYMNSLSNAQVQTAWQPCCHRCLHMSLLAVSQSMSPSHYCTAGRWLSRMLYMMLQLIHAASHLINCSAPKLWS
jgi:hypothetical protein